MAARKLVKVTMVDWGAEEHSTVWEVPATWPDEEIIRMARGYFQPAYVEVGPAEEGAVPEYMFGDVEG
jgi:hypothetical protein